MKRYNMFNVSKSDTRVDYPHLEQIWMHFTVSQCMHLGYFSRIKEVKKKSSSSYGLKKSGEVTGMKWILRYGKGKFWGTRDVDLGL